ncbi:multimerin-1-like [Pristis pectinata]|uniref:multimerin-1-like n=1 Tax=Pristis pectinata TaxID=685728 RepID=UPI00223DA361|nr:multimerin-1-like [Pristis pectinata]
MAVTPGRTVISISVGMRSLVVFVLVFTLSKVYCVVPDANSSAKKTAGNGNNVFTAEQGRKLQTGLREATIGNSSSNNLPVANRYPRQVDYIMGGVNKLSNRQKRSSYSRVGSSKPTFETARGKNWCAYVHTRLSPTVTIENVQSQVLLTSKSCVLKMGNCQPRYQIRNQPVYRMKHKIVTSLNWKCCPGYIGADCQPKDYLKRQAEENQAESQRTGADLPKDPQRHYDPALAAKFNDKLYNQEIKLGLLQKKVVNISAYMNDVWSLLYSLEGKIDEDNGKDLQSTFKGTKSRGIQELVKELVSQQVRSFQGNMEEMVAQLYKTISSINEELQSTKETIQQLNRTILSLSGSLHSTTVEQDPAPPSELHEIREQMEVLRADVSLACHNTSQQLTKKHKSLQRQLEEERERTGALLEVINQTFSLARETQELQLSSQVLQDVPEQEGTQTDGMLQRYLSNVSAIMKMHGRWILQLNSEVKAHELQLLNLTSASSQKEMEIRTCQVMVEECKITLGSRLHQVENEILNLNKTFSDTFTPLGDILETIDERVSNLSYDFEIFQQLVEDQGRPLESSRADSGHIRRQDLTERLDNLSSKVASLSVFVKSTVGAQLIRNQSQAEEESFRGLLAECRLEIEDSLNDTMTVINNAVDSMRDDYYILKHNVTDLRRYTLELFRESTIKHNYELTLFPQIAQLNESFKVLVADVVRHKNALEMIGVLQGLKKTEVIIPPILMNVSQLLNKTATSIEDFQQRIHLLEETALSSSSDTKDYQSRILALESQLSSVLANSKSLPKIKSKLTQGAKIQAAPPKYQELSRKVSGLQLKWTNLNDRVSRMKEESDQTHGLCQNLSLLLTHVNTSVPRVTMPTANLNITALQQDLREFVQTTSWATAELFFTNITMFMDRAISNVVRNITKIQKQVKQLYKRPKVVNKTNFTVSSGRSQRYADKVTDPVESVSCDSAPCQNGGTCINQRKGFVCVCCPPFGGPSCDIKLLDANALKTDFSRGSYRYAPMVAFFVAHTYAMNTSGPIRFNHLYVNYGASYAPGSGKFSIPFLGVYVFKYTIESFSSHLSGFLVVDGVDKLAFQYEGTDNSVPGSRTVTGDAVLELNYGQSVWLRLTSGSIPEKFPPVTTFGGYLLYRT